MRAFAAGVVAALSLTTPAPAVAAAPYVPVTAAEKQAMRSAVNLVLDVERNGEAWRLCSAISPTRLRATFGTVERCRAQARRSASRPCKTCTYRLYEVLGFYATASDRRQKRKTVLWEYVVRGDPAFDGASGLEIRLEQESGRWVFESLLKDGSAR
jgi:hypothetical protein